MIGDLSSDRRLILDLEAMRVRVCMTAVLCAAALCATVWVFYAAPPAEHAHQALLRSVGIVKVPGRQRQTAAAEPKPAAAALAFVNMHVDVPHGGARHAIRTG